MGMEIDGILVSMSEGLYIPMVQVRDWRDKRVFICDYNSTAATEAGLSNPKHWAHAVWRSLDLFCRENQAVLQGDSMETYKETAMDRAMAKAATTGKIMDSNGCIEGVDL